MGEKFQGRRVASMDDISKPGDYFGPTTSYTGGLPAVFFKKPNGSAGHVCSPPHTFVEHADGSLEIAPSISHLRKGEPEFQTDSNVYPNPGDGWHGWLRPGHIWESV